VIGYLDCHCCPEISILLREPVAELGADASVNRTCGTQTMEDISSGEIPLVQIWL
jgi:hypothetical protein